MSWSVEALFPVPAHLVHSSNQALCLQPIKLAQECRQRCQNPPLSLENGCPESFLILAQGDTSNDELWTTRADLSAQSCSHAEKMFITAVTCMAGDKGLNGFGTIILL